MRVVIAVCERIEMVDLRGFVCQLCVCVCVCVCVCACMHVSYTYAMYVHNVVVHISTPLDLLCFCPPLVLVTHLTNSPVASHAVLLFITHSIVTHSVECVVCLNPNCK